MDIVKFLNDRLDEDEQFARDAEYSSGGGTWTFEGPLPNGKARPGSLHMGDSRWETSDTWAELDGYQMEHIARHDPARVLREVAAKRDILERHCEVGKSGATFCPVCGHYYDVTKVERCPELRGLAAIWSDHADYSPAWAVSE